MGLRHARQVCRWHQAMWCSCHAGGKGYHSEGPWLPVQFNKAKYKILRVLVDEKHEPAMHVLAAQKASLFWVTSKEAWQLVKGGDCLTLLYPYAFCSGAPSMRSTGTCWSKSREGHENVRRARAPLLWRKTDGTMVVQPEEEKEDLSVAFQYIKRPTGKLEIDSLSESTVTGQGLMASE